jgi:general L-amino acid transport system ATP-binding protein
MVFQQFNFVPASERAGPDLVKKIPRAGAEERAMHYLRRVKIPEQAGKYPGQLSGGQQQSHPLWPQTTSEQKTTAKGSVHA